MLNTKGVTTLQLELLALYFTHLQVYVMRAIAWA
jgi:hypothetical protein